MQAVTGIRRWLCYIFSVDGIFHYKDWLFNKIYR